MCLACLCKRKHDVTILLEELISHSCDSIIVCLVDGVSS